MTNDDREKWFWAEIDRYRTENATLRKLVREVYDNADVGWLGTNWDERAEKILNLGETNV